MAKKEEEIRDLIRGRLLAGELPHSDGHRVYAGKGDGHACACCDQPITRALVEYEVEIEETGRSLPMHFHCYHSWHDESLGLQADKAAGD
jgi:hypothetical protein